ncbi:MAG: alpha/beta hydrolase [Clostridia bacterium]|nr:alpha/beta hydrolase [Clostridia bacterium]
MKRTLPLKRTRAFIAMAGGIVYKQVPDWYGSDSRALSLNLIRTMDGKAHPTVVWLTGGAWQKVTRNAHVPEMVYLAEAGYTVATVEYRSSEDDVFPAQIEDVKAAIRFLRKNAALYQVDPDRVAVMGESAGGHLAALAGTTSGTGLFDVGENLDFSSDVQCAVDWYGPADFTEFRSEPVPELFPFPPEALLIGGPTGSNPEKARAASPVTYVHAGTPPFLILHGTADQLVPFAQSEKLYEKLTEAGAEAELVALEGANHGDPMFVTPEVKATILDFLDRHLK